MTNNLPASQNHFDVIIIGSGPGGEGAAMGLTKAGFKVAIIEREDSVGGGCTHWGTIPSKSLRHAVSRIIEFNQNPLYCNDTSTLHRTFSQILHHATEVVSKQTRMRQGFYDRNHCHIIHGEAKFIDSHCVSVTTLDGSIDHFSAERFIIATGSRPYQPTTVDFTHPRIYDSDSILQLAHDPRHILIYGAGVIGCEYASIFRRSEEHTV